MTFANFPELGRALTQQCSRAVLPEQEFAFLQRIVLVETRTLDLLDLVVPSTNSATQPQLRQQVLFLLKTPLEKSPNILKSLALKYHRRCNIGRYANYQTPTAQE